MQSISSKKKMALPITKLLAGESVNIATSVAPIALCIIRFQIIKQGIVKIAKDEAKNPIFEEIAKKPRKVKEYSKLWFNFF